MTDARTQRPAASRALALLGLGALCALGFELAGAPRGDAVGSRAPAVWVADRGAGALLGLDDELFVVRRIDLREPLAVARAPDGGLWALSARDGRGARGRRLLRFDERGEKRIELALPGGTSLVALAEGGVLCIDGASDGIALVIDERGRTRPLSGTAGATCAAASDETIVVGGPGALVRELDAQGVELRRIELARAPLALARDGGGGWCALAGTEAQLLVRLGPTLELVSARATELVALALAPVPGEERAWLCDPDAQRLELHGPRGVELSIGDPELADAARVLCAAGGGALVAVPGALLRFDGRGRPLPGQGGFDFLVDAAEASSDRARSARALGILSRLAARAPLPATRAAPPRRASSRPRSRPRGSLSGSPRRARAPHRDRARGARHR